MKHTYIKGIIVTALVLGTNGLMNVALNPKIEVSRYRLNADKLDLKKGAIYTLATEGSNGSSVKWLSSNDKIATVNSNGQIIAKEPGQTVISAKIRNEYKDIIINVRTELKADILIYNNTQITTAKSEEIDKISISKFKLTLSSNTYTFNGKAKKPTVQLETSNHKILKKNRDYKVKYSNNKKVGTAKVIVTGLNDYTGTLVGTFKIEKKQNPTPNKFSEDNKTIASSSSKTDQDSNTDTDSVSLTTEYGYTNSTLTPTTPSTKSTSSSTGSVKHKSTTSPSSAKKKEKESTSTKKTASSNNQTKKSNTNNAKKDTATNTNASSNSETSSSASNNTSGTSSNTSSESSNSSSSSNNSNQSSSTSDSSSQNNNNSTQSNEISKTETSNE